MFKGLSIAKICLRPKSAPLTRNKMKQLPQNFPDFNKNTRVQSFVNLE